MANVGKRTTCIPPCRDRANRSASRPSISAYRLGVPYPWSEDYLLLLLAVASHHQKSRNTRCRITSNCPASCVRTPFPAVWEATANTIGFCGSYAVNFGAVIRTWLALEAEMRWYPWKGRPPSSHSLLHFLGCRAVDHPGCGCSRS